MEIDQTRIESAIVREVSDRIISNDELYNRIEQAVDARINHHFATIGDMQMQVAIEAAIKQGFEHEYCKVDAFGRREGEPTTIRAELNRLVGDYWNTKVDRQGKPITSSYGEHLNRAEWVMTQLCASDFQGQMKQHIVNLGGALKDKLRAELHETVNKLLADVFHVRSIQDEAAKRSDRSLIDQPAKK